MKKTLFGLLCSVLLFGCAERSQEAVLTFKVTNPTATEIVVVCHNDIKTFPIDGDGTAVATLEGMDAVYARVWYGRDNRKVYVEKGDNATITFDGEDFGGTFCFEGEKKAAVEYLNKVTLSALQDEAYALEFAEYIDKLNNKRDNALKILKATDLKGCGGFLKAEEGRIRYAYAAPLLMYPVGHMLMSQNMDYTPNEEYYSILESYFVENRSYSDLDEYRSFITEAAHVLDKVNRGERNVRLKTAAQMQYITDKFSDSKVVSALLHTLAETYVEMYGVEGTEEIQTLHATFVKDEAMLEAFAAKLDKYNLSKPGKKSPDFEAVDLNGKVWTLADFKGKYLYIDLKGDDSGVLIGKRGDTLDAIQHIVQLALNMEIKGGEKIRIDTEGYREKRTKTLVSLAKSIANRVIKSRGKYELEPMKAYERKIIHAALQSYPMLTTYSVGVEPERRLIVAFKPKNKEE